MIHLFGIKNGYVRCPLETIFEVLRDENVIRSYKKMPRHQSV